MKNLETQTIFILVQKVLKHFLGIPCTLYRRPVTHNLICRHPEEKTKMYNVVIDTFNHIGITCLQTGRTSVVYLLLLHAILRVIGNL